MGDEERALLAAIVAEPDDDTPRLVYADWLDEYDRPGEAELIRLQCGLSRTKGRPELGAQRRAWATRLSRVMAEHAGPWRAGLPAVDGVTWGRFDRGVIDTVIVRVRRVCAAGRLADLDRVFDRTPLRVVEVVAGTAAEVRAILCWSGLSRFRVFRLSPRRWFDFALASCGEIAGVLAAHPWGPQPDTWDLRRLPLGREDVERLAERLPARHHPGLRWGLFHRTGPGSSAPVLPSEHDDR